MPQTDSTDSRESRNITLGLLPMLVAASALAAPAALAQTTGSFTEPAPLADPTVRAPLPPATPAYVVAPAQPAQAVVVQPVPAALPQQQAIQLEPIHLTGTAVRSQAPAPQQYMEAYKVDGVASPTFTQPLLDTPKTITVITQREIEERGAASLAEVLRTTPGITLGSGEGGTPVGDRPFIRGFEASTDIFVDGQRNLGRSAYESFNSEAIEVSKGPGSAYTGRGSTGGSLNIVSKQPADETFLHSNSTLGTDSYLRQTVDANYYHAPADVAVRLNALYHDADVPGRGPRDEKRWGVAPSIAWGLRGPTQAVLSFYHSKSEETPDLGVPFQTASYWANARGEPGRVASKDDPFRPVDDIDRDNFYGSVHRDFRDVTTTIGTFKLRHEFENGLTAQNVFSYNRGTNEYAITRPTINASGVQVNRDLRSSARRNTSWGNRTDFTYELDTGPIAHDLAFGAEITRDKLESANLSFSDPASLSALPPTDLYNPDPWTAFPFSPTIGAYGEPTRTKTASAYLFDTLKFNDQWLLSLGLRYDDYKVSSGALENHSKMWNYQAALTYKPTPDGSVYLAFGTSSNPSGETAGQSGGADGAAGGGLNNNTVNLDPEETRSYEAGVKWDFFDGRLGATAAAFYTDKTNQRATDPVTGLVALVGNSEAKGFELGLRGEITDRWRVSAGYTYVDSRIKDDGRGTNDGNRAKYIAPHSASLWTTYDVTPALTLGGGVSYMSDRFASDDNTLELPSHVRVDLMASYEFNDNFTLRLNANNVFDEKIYDGSHVGLFANMAPGRLVTLTGEVKF
ncbi:TonB-dependent siderophore receptor [Neomegalonema sp.]|uniref:TonB-dependent receptor n=1 Tax=Neomegalonema sp. TaxID=2039713 RepID=UPI00261E4D2B|nr:TonB-dependent siderophore receptor [Neomegalonema sp.]MDD2869553.1 TonB-dependent siderophore receptor [Neomegalonema sp.]